MIQVSIWVCLCVSLSHMCLYSTVYQLIHYQSMYPSVCMCQRMCHSCLSVGTRDNTEPREAACLSVVAPCSWPTLGEVN